MLGLGLGANKIGLRGGLQAIINKYGFHNYWDFDKSTVIGSTTTLLDYKGVHNLSNPAAANQPTLNSPDSDFNNKNSGTFVNSDPDYLYKAVANYQGSDTSGVFTAIIKTPSAWSGVAEGLISITDDTEADTCISLHLNNGNLDIFYDEGATTNIFRATTPIALNTLYIISGYSNGSTYKSCINETIDTGGMFSGSNDGTWFSALGNTNSINFGVLNRSGAMRYYNSKIKGVGYMPFVSDAEVQALHSELNKIVKIY